MSVVLKATRVPREHREPKAMLGLPAVREPKERLGPQEHRERPGLPGLKVRTDHKEQVVPREHKGRLVLREVQGLRERQEPREHKGRLVLRGLKVRTDHRVRADQLVLRVRPAQPGHKERRGLKVVRSIRLPLPDIRDQAR